MKTSDVLVGLILLAVGGGLALLLGGGLPSQAVLALFMGATGAYVGGRIRRRRGH
jgi:membrane protein implicated in regulation of membrane protease activity